MHNLSDDLENISNATKQYWKQVKLQNFFVTGGTGFFGKWLLASFNYINEKLELDNNLFVLSRNPEAFLDQNPEFAELNKIKFIRGDVRNFTVPADVKFDFIIHAATDASVKLNMEDPVLMYETIVDGTKQILELAKKHHVKAVLYTSSGAVYGTQPSEITHVDESFNGSPDIYSANAAYGEGKRVAEMLANFYAIKHGVNSKIARCFAFIGPYLPLDGAFAAGNFINDILKGNDINISGDGTPYRSYLYAADLTIWLWAILLKGETCRPYNVGSDEAVTIKELAELTAGLKPATKVNIALPANKAQKPLRYVPSVNRAKKELNLKIDVPLRLALEKTLNFYQNNNEC